eukprot:CAMPEP_0198202258 /NCGR_PEP_ID=MMETSP1445-20131203/5375_1 /TAXON_ID=36898 /ORGANISM="Pyramimonas sp., Strain CCMP2087" /LENGTH=387 /DNA_ID=CAMNT_0043873073 /DNA_START=241 /DNA_END=1404 /DNA_ORIENTATION=-
MPRGGARANSGGARANTGGARARAGAPVGNTNTAGEVGRRRGAPLGNTNAAGQHRNAAGHVGRGAGAPLGNTNAAGHRNAAGHVGGGVRAGAGAPVGNAHRAAAETSTRIEYDEKIDALQRSADCAEDPFNVVIEERHQSEALRAVPEALKLATRIVVCAVCDHITEESKTKLCLATMDQPPPDSWLARLQKTRNSIVIEGAPDPESLRRQYRVPKLKDMSPGWSTLLLSPRGIYPVLSGADTQVPDTCVFPRGSWKDVHVEEQVTHASLAKACVCDECGGCLRMTTRAPHGTMPKFACANDLCSGVAPKEWGTHSHAEWKLLTPYVNSIFIKSARCFTLPAVASTASNLAAPLPPETEARRVYLNRARIVGHGSLFRGDVPQLLNT